MSAPDTKAVLSKPAEVAFKLLVLVITIASLGFAGAQALAVRPSGVATAVQVEQLGSEIGALRLELREYARRVQAVEIQQARDQGARDALHKER